MAIEGRSRSECQFADSSGSLATVAERGGETAPPKGLMGDSAAARATLDAIETARANHRPDTVHSVTRILVISYTIGCVLQILKLGVKRFPLDKDRVHWLIEPWIVQAALDRFGAKRLASAEQQEVWNATRSPEKIEWPVWWTERG